jgi:O-antigen/teichoic acid export membrane protein
MPLARRARWLGAGLLDQAVVAAANAGTTLLGLALLDRARGGLMVLTVGVGYFVMYLNRAFVGDVLIALGSRYDGERRDRLVRDGLATALVGGSAAALLLLTVWWVWPEANLRLLGWLAPFLPAVLLHDTARCGYLAARQPERALVVDLLWVGTQACVVAGLVFAGGATAGALLAAWGLGACAGSTFFLLRTGTRPWHGNPRRWLVTTRHLSGWFTATAVVGQLHVQAINFLVVVRLSTVEIAGLRLAQTALMQPVQNLITALQGLLVPGTSRLAAVGQRAVLHRQTMRLAVGFAVLGGLIVVAVRPVAELVVAHVPKYADTAPLILPTSLQAALYLVQLPFTAALRGMHRARLLFVHYLVFATVSLTGLVAGAAADRLPGAVWGLAAGSAVGLALMVGLYAVAVRHLDAAAGSGRAPGGEAVPESTRSAGT